MFAFLKAAVLGLVLGFVVSLVLGHAGSEGGVLNVHHYVIQGVGFYWSWMLFIAGTLLAFAIILMMD